MSHLSIKEMSDTGRTKVFLVASIGGSALGAIRWYAHWRRYTLQPDSGTVWDAACLREVVEFIRGLMEERKER